MSDGVILLAYGGPDSLEDIPKYLLDIRQGRPTPQHLIDEIATRYRLIGGKSPLPAITHSAACKLQETVGIPIYVGMRHWHPYIGEVVGQMAADGITRVVAIIMAPHASGFTTGAYRGKVMDGLADYPEIELRFVESWHTQADYIDTLAADLRETLEHFPGPDRDRVLVVFSAHSLPERVVRPDDPYADQLDETARLVAAGAELPDDSWIRCFQSAGAGGGPWLGPQLDEVIRELAEQGKRNIVVAPIGFVSDHVEVQFDIDIEARQLAESLGMQLERPPMLNDRPGMIAALTGIVQEALIS